jgi:hypothetical protein
MIEGEANHKGKKLIKTFQDACERKTNAERELNSASCAKTNARTALAKWLLPSDAKPGEKFSLWDRDKHENECLFEVTVPNDRCGEYQVVMRYRK